MNVPPGIKRFVRAVMPPLLLAGIQRRFFRVSWSGDYTTWAGALAGSTGYAGRPIVQRVATAARLVRDGGASYERDGVAFHEPPPGWPGIPFLRAAAAPGGKLAVLDFGGSLGSVYFQVRAQLGNLASLRWCVVEQPAFVETGRREFQNGELEFFSSVEEACAAAMPDVLILASVLPYLPSPLATLAELMKANPACILVERTGFTTLGGTRLTVQRVPRSIYPASYPCWFLDRAQFLAVFAGRYRLMSEDQAEVNTPAGLEFRSFQFARLDA